MDSIKSFDGKYRFLSNFWEAPVLYDGLFYQNNEAAFQAAKVEDHNERGTFQGLNPSQAKKKGRYVELRSDWEDIKTNVMVEIVLDKFIRNPILTFKLILTKNAYLEEGNTWNDKIWGVCNGVGENRLGHILMGVRQILFNFYKGRELTYGVDKIIPEELILKKFADFKDGDMLNSFDYITNQAILDMKKYHTCITILPPMVALAHNEGLDVKKAVDDAFAEWESRSMDNKGLVGEDTNEHTVVNLHLCIPNKICIKHGFVKLSPKISILDIDPSGILS